MQPGCEEWQELVINRKRGNIMSLSNLLSIISIIVTALGFAFIYAQIHEAKAQREQSKREVKISNAIGIANRFEMLIENEIHLIGGVLDQSDYKKVIDGIPETSSRLFDKVEWETLCKKYFELEQYKDYLDASVALEKYINTIAIVYMSSNQKISQQTFVILNALNACSWQLTEKEKNCIENHTKDNDELYRDTIVKASELDFYKNFMAHLWSSTITNLLNKLESIAMEFNTELADDDVVYHSLHQLYIKTIKTLYPQICNLNNGNVSDKYYSNIIELYVKWSDKNSRENDEEVSRRSIKTKAKY